MSYTINIDITSIVEQIKLELKNYIDAKIEEIKKISNHEIEEIKGVVDEVIDQTINTNNTNPIESNNDSLNVEENHIFQDNLNQDPEENLIFKEDLSQNEENNNPTENEPTNVEKVEEENENEKKIVILHSAENLNIEQLRILNKKLLNLMPKNIKRQLNKSKSIYNNRSKKGAIELYKKLLEVIEKSELVEIKYLFKYTFSDMSSEIEKSLDILNELISKNPTKFGL
ncbi:MAG: hypothetical protein QXW48_01440 [Thermoplasmata archaeon]